MIDSSIRGPLAAALLAAARPEASWAAHGGRRFQQTWRLYRDADTALLLNMDAAIGLWTYDESPRAVHPRVHGDCVVGPVLGRGR